MNLVHESEAQRQHARIKIPATITAENITFKLVDLSSGGFCIEDPMQKLEQNKLYDGRFTLNIDGFAFSYKIRFSTVEKSQNSSNERVGCTFQDMDQRFSSALRYIITAFMGGEIISSGDIIHALSRNNMTQARGKDGTSPMTAGERLKAIIGSSLVLLAGVFAFAFVAVQLVSIYFVSNSNQASVTTETYSLNMPQDGIVKLLLPAETAQVKTGQLLATYSSTSADLNLKGLPLATQKLLADIEQPINRGSIISPCDCDLISSRIVDGQFIARGDLVFKLIPPGSPAYVQASFDFEAGESLAIGDTVKFKVFGQTTYESGVIENLSIAEADGETGSEIVAAITPTNAISRESFKRPVKVIAAPSFFSDRVLDWL